MPGHGGPHSTVQGWVARRWDPAVQERLHKLFFALGKEFDGKIEGINLPETSVRFGETSRLFPKGFTPDVYRDAIITNMKALKQAFPRSVALQYANFMPGEWLPDDDKGYLKSVYAAARESHIGVGGPDLLPYRPGQLHHAYPFIKDASGSIPTAIAVQEGNYADPDPATGKRPTIEQLFQFASKNLNVDYLFWSPQEPFYSEEIIPLLTKQVRM
ncbi:MAG: hypothetical protein J2P36_34865 [Ktedonobacteraceae bacterium]|nr:hypothetical protein [Ktedonobacteraceae bacterium]